MRPDLIGIVKSYGFMLSLSFALGMWLSVRRGRRYNLSSETILDQIFGVMISSLVGVRLVYVLTHLDSFHPWYRAFFIWDGGMTLYGGILAAMAAVWWMCRRDGIPFLVIADVFSPGVMLGIGLTRIGCFMAGCCFGKPTGCSCGVTFPVGSEPWAVWGSVAIHPSQLYASAGAFAVFGLLLLLERLPSPRGATFGRFLVLYGISRFVVDFFRYYEPEQVMALGWSNNQWLSLCLIAVGATVLGLGAAGRLGGPWRAEVKS